MMRRLPASRIAGAKEYLRPLGYPPIEDCVALPQKHSDEYWRTLPVRADGIAAMA